MVLNTQLEHAPVWVFQPKIGDVSHLLCTHLVESDATGLLTPIISTPWWSSWVNWPDPVGLMFSLLWAGSPWSISREPRLLPSLQILNFKASDWHPKKKLCILFVSGLKKKICNRGMPSERLEETGLVAPGLVWRWYVLLIISIGTYYLRKEVYLIPLSKCVYREAQQYISMLRKQNIRTSMLYFMHVNKGRLLYLICFCKLSGS